MTLEELDDRRVEFFHKAHRLAFHHYIRWGKVPEVLTQLMEETSSMKAFMAFLKYNPNHKPAGTPEGGQFDFAPGGGSGADSARKPRRDTARNIFRNFPNENYAEPELGHPPSPVDILLARKPVISFLGFIFRQSIQRQYYLLQGQRYSSHALDQMEARGIPPSVVKNTLQRGTKIPSHSNTTIFYDRENNVTVITGNQSKQVVTVRRGKP